MARRSLFAGGEKEAAETSLPLRPLNELEPGQQAECFVLLAEKHRGETRDGKPYFRCQFRDRERTVAAMIWNDSSWFEVCEQNWQPAEFFRIRCRYQENQFGPQVELLQIRKITAADREEGFDEAQFVAKSRFDADGMFLELRTLVDQQIVDSALRTLVLLIVDEHAEAIREFPAASRNHHAYRGGFLEHVLSVTRTAAWLADKYRAHYPAMTPPLSKDLVIAGAVLHDIGKLRELSIQPQGADYTAVGRLIGHILLGRDLVRDYAARIDRLDPDLLLRLEHMIVAHQNLPEWGSPIAPHTPEALLVHYADDIDAKFQMMVFALAEKLPDDAQFTSRNNPLRRSIFRGLAVPGDDASS